MTFGSGAYGCLGHGNCNDISQVCLSACVSPRMSIYVCVSVFVSVCICLVVCHRLGGGLSVCLMDFSKRCGMICFKFVKGSRNS